MTTILQYDSAENPIQLDIHQRIERTITDYISPVIMLEFGKIRDNYRRNKAYDYFAKSDASGLSAALWKLEKEGISEERIFAELKDAINEPIRKRKEKKLRLKNLLRDLCDWIGSEDNNGNDFIIIHEERNRYSGQLVAPLSDRRYPA